jgi:zinc protease
VLRVYEQYIKGEDFVATSFVPQGQGELALDGSELAKVEEEEIVQNADGESFTLPEETTYQKTPSSFDRSVEPPYGESPDLTVPDVWETQLANGLDIFGIENYELPLVEFEIIIKGGLMLEDPEKTGVSNLLAELLTKGTANKTPQELEEAIDELGASIRVNAGRQNLTIRGNSLARNYDETIKLMEEILLEPRWDEREFELTKQSMLSQIAQQSANPNSIASNTFNKLLYGEDHILSFNTIGTTNSIEEITLGDLKAYYENYLSPSVASMHVVGALSQSEVVASLSGIEGRWDAKEVKVPAFDMPEAPAKSQVYFYDVPDAKQSVLRFGYLALPETHPDFYPAEIMNYKLGGGGFASRFTQELREGKGYTYGIGSGFSGSDIAGPFTISSGVRTNVTYESAALVKEILEEYPETFTEEDLKNTKSFLLKSNARRFETLGSKLNMLDNISSYGWSADYMKEREEIVKNMTKEEIQELARTYANPDKMIWLMVGDADTQMDRLEQLGFGAPILVNEDFKEGN